MALAQKVVRATRNVIVDVLSTWLYLGAYFGAIMLLGLVAVGAIHLVEGPTRDVHGAVSGYVEKHTQEQCRAITQNRSPSTDDIVYFNRNCR